MNGIPEKKMSGDVQVAKAIIGIEIKTREIKLARIKVASKIKQGWQ